MAGRVLRVTAVLALLAGCGAGHVVTGGGSGNGIGRVSGPGEVVALDPRVAATVSKAEARLLRAGDAAFAGRLLALLARSNQTVVLSPFGISEAMAMLYAGARGQTASQIASALQFRLPGSRLHAAFNSTDQELASVNGRLATLDVANALFGERGYRFRRAFLGLLARDYGTGVHTVDFSQAPAQALAAINQWVSGRTHGKIPRLLAPQDIDQLTRLVLVNAVYLHAKWLLPFQPQATSPAPFHSPTGTVTLPTMHQTAQLNYLRGAGYQALELPYQGGRLTFDMLLPNPGGLPMLLHRLASGDPLDLLRGLKPQGVQLSLPKLRLRTRFQLQRALSQLGMPLAFLPGQADLSGIAGQPGDLYLKAVVHEAFLGVDEAGTEAAAATGAIINATSGIAAPIIFDVNRPFVFILRDRKTNAILFLGTIAHP
jgi:serpin B